MWKTFTATSIEQLRERAASVTTLPGELPSGWSKSPVDPMDLVKVFEPLGIKPGYILRAYQFVEGNNGNGFVWAMPVDAEFPDPEDCPRLEGMFLEPPKPPAALDNVMDSIEGDGSPWSYMCASILMRELTEFGAMWHGCNWNTHRVLDKPPWNDGKEPDSIIETASPTTEPWEWIDDQPGDWKPFVEKKRKAIETVFLTYSGLGQEAIYRHVDRYPAGEHRPKVSTEVIARGGGGFVF